MTSSTLFVLSGPSGAGKDTVLSELKGQGFPLHFVVTATTRPPRPGERDGVDYHFLSEEGFHRLKEEGELVEWAQVYGYWYGVPQKEIKTALGLTRVVSPEAKREATAKVIAKR